MAWQFPKMTRRSFLKNTSLGAVGATICPNWATSSSSRKYRASAATPMPAPSSPPGAKSSASANRPAPTWKNSSNATAAPFCGASCPLRKMGRFDFCFHAPTVRTGGSIAEPSPSAAEKAAPGNLVQKRPFMLKPWPPNPQQPSTRSRIQVRWQCIVYGLNPIFWAAAALGRKRQFSIFGGRAGQIGRQ